MSVNQSLFLFLAAAVTGMFGFLSVVVYVSTPSKERQARDRMALLKTLAEQPGENAVRFCIPNLRAGYRLRTGDQRQKCERERHFGLKTCL